MSENPLHDKITAIQKVLEALTDGDPQRLIRDVNRLDEMKATIARYRAAGLLPDPETEKRVEFLEAGFKQVVSLALEIRALTNEALSEILPTLAMVLPSIERAMNPSDDKERMPN